MFSHLNGEPLNGSQSPGLGRRSGISAAALPALHRPVASGIPSTLLIGLPLVLVNLLSASASYCTLVHHYSLPLAVVAVVACIDGLRRQSQPQRGFPWMLLGHSLLAGVAKPLVLHRALPDPIAPAARGQERHRL